MASLHPEHGARMVLERRGDAPPAYDVVAYLPDARVYQTYAVMDATHPDGPVQIEDWSAPPPAWVVEFLDRLLKSLAKKHAQDGRWPRRIARWRVPLGESE